MRHLFLFLLPLILPATAIKVPVDKTEDDNEKLTIVEKQEQSTPIYYIKDDANVDSYLVPPDPHDTEEVFSDVLVTPATYLLPPSKEQRADFYAPVVPSAQSDWLPILQTQPQRNARFQRPLLESIPIFLNKAPQEGQLPIAIPIPSTQLLPPKVDAVNEYFTSLIPEAETNQQIHVPDFNLPVYEEDVNGPILNSQLESVEPTIALHLLPPKLPQPLKPPTKLYPKKYLGEFKPVPIPLTQYSEENEFQLPKLSPAKPFKPLPSVEGEELTQSDEKNLYHFKKAEHKRKLKGQEESAKEHYDDAAAETHGGPTSTEQETSATNYRYPGRNVYPAPVQEPTSAPSSDPATPPAPDGRTEFRMHGMKGPHSYQFGYDTGKGKNRQFRYEERDNDGLVHGHYGYMDMLGKLRVVNYSAHPEYGFRAEEPVEKE